MRAQKAPFLPLQCMRKLPEITRQRNEISRIEGYWILDLFFFPISPLPFLKALSSIPTSSWMFLEKSIVPEVGPHSSSRSPRSLSKLGSKLVEGVRVRHLLFISPPPIRRTVHFGSYCPPERRVAELFFSFAIQSPFSVITLPPGDGRE